jgi:hypothetical protein
LVLRANFLLVLLPLIYWILRSIFWPEKIQYHDVSLSSATSILPFVLLVLLVCGSMGILQKRTNPVVKRKILIVLSGFAALAAGSLAYVIYGYFQTDWSIFSQNVITLLGRSDWYSRHQTLQPLGTALLIIGIVGLLPNFIARFAKQVQTFILVVCVVFNIGFGFEYVVDHSKQKEVIGVLKEEGESELGSNYQFVDQTTLLNARGRAYRERDWKGLIWLAYGVESMQLSRVATMCEFPNKARLVLIQGPETHWEALKNWVSDGDMGFKVTVDDAPGACKPEMVTSEGVSGTIPILFYFTGAKG